MTLDIDDIEARLKDEVAENYYGLELIGIYLEVEEARALCAEVRELRAVITAHNERVTAACKWRQDNGYCDYAKRGDLCPDCPLEWEIEK